jgi:hypothetical protein
VCVCQEMEMEDALQDLVVSLEEGRTKLHITKQVCVCA